MAYILDGVVILIFLLAVHWGYRRGFFQSMINLAGCIAAALIASSLSKPLASSIFDIFMADNVHKTVSSQIVNTDAASVKTAVGHILQNLPGPVANKMIASGFTPDKITNDLSGSLNQSAAVLTDNLVNTVVKPIAVSLLSTLCFAVLFIVITILIGILASMVNRVFRLPVLRQVNGVLGAAFGAVQGVLFVFVAVTVMSMIAASSKSDGMLTQDVMEHTKIVHAVESVNPITDVLHSLLKT